MNSRKSLGKRAVTGIFLVAGLVFLSSSHQVYAQKKAVLFVSSGLSSYENWVASKRVKAEKGILEGLGYSVEQKVATADVILKALLSKQYGAMTYFGHGTEPSMEGLDAKRWKGKVFQALLNRYSGQNVPNAFQKADEESKNFGLELVRNNSCYSLADTSLANQFVKRGGLYYGVKGLYAPCPTPRALLQDVSWNLTEYRVPPTPGQPPPKNPNADSSLLVKVVMTCGAWGDKGQYAYPASDVSVIVGGQSLITKGGTARTGPIAAGSVSVSVPGKKIVSVVVTANSSGKMYTLNAPKSNFSVNLPPVSRGGAASHYAVAIRLVDCD